MIHLNTQCAKHTLNKFLILFTIHIRLFSQVCLFFLFDICNLLLTKLRCLCNAVRCF